MESQRVLYVAIARTSLKKILFQYLPNKKEKKNFELVLFFFMDPIFAAVASYIFLLLINSMAMTWQIYCRHQDRDITRSRPTMAIGTLNLIHSLNCASLVSFIFRLCNKVNNISANKRLIPGR